MTITRRQTIAGAAILAVLLVAAFAIWAAERRAALERVLPAWLNPQQPPESLAVELLPVSPEASWAANRCAPMTASCVGRGAGSRIRRDYPATLADSDASFISASAGLDFQAG